MKQIEYKRITKTVLEIINLIRRNGKTHQQFRNFNEKLDFDVEPRDPSFYCARKWLSTSNVLNRFVELCIILVKEIKKPYSSLENDKWMQDLNFFADIMPPAKFGLSTPIGKDKLILDLF